MTKSEALRAIRSLPATEQRDVIRTLIVDTPFDLDILAEGGLRQLILARIAELEADPQPGIPMDDAISSVCRKYQQDT